MYDRIERKLYSCLNKQQCIHLSEDCYGNFIAKSNNNHHVLLCMKKLHVFVFSMMILLVLMIPLMNSIQAFSKIGPTPIPGNLIPFPSVGHDKNHDKSPIIPSHKK